MIAFVRGQLIHQDRDSALIDVQGVGYQVHLTPRHLRKLPTGGEVTLVTHLLHREDAMELFGFESIQEKELFLQLNRVSGIGAKSALAIIAELNVEELVKAIVLNQPKVLSRAPGVGLKTAQRIILELKEKLTKMHPSISLQHISTPAAPDMIAEVEMTLLALGYTDSEIQKAMERFLPQVARDASAEDTIRYLLEQLSANG